jgi:hypothetical protein
VLVRVERGIDVGDYHDENTLFKVREVLTDTLHLDGQLAADIIREMGNAGILFREFREDWSHDFVQTTETVVELAEDGFTLDMYLRLECLTQAVASAKPGFSDEKPVIERARYFEQYVRNGAFEEGVMKHG